MKTGVTWVKHLGNVIPHNTPDCQLLNIEKSPLIGIRRDYTAIERQNLWSLQGTDYQCITYYISAQYISG